jgi:hypothetical protein
MWYFIKTFNTRILNSKIQVQDFKIAWRWYFVPKHVAKIKELEF